MSSLGAGAREGDELRDLAAARVGETLGGKWHLDRLIGFGGMAAVYEATHRNGMRGAVKLLHPELIRSADAKARFLREGYVANAVGHKGAVAVLDDDTTEGGQVYLVMELLDGATLEALAAARPTSTLDASTVLQVADELLDILAAAHDKGIVHRDLKPENLFLTKDGSVRVLDFGIARFRQSKSAPATSTRTGDSMGTPAFMPPEQALGNWDDVDQRTDLWAVGATMFTLLSGRLVHDADTVQKVMLAAMSKPAPSLATVVSGLPAELVELVDKALSRERDDRFPDARAMQAAVRAARAALTANPARGAPLLTVTSASSRASAVTHPALLTAPPVARDGADARRSRGSLIALAALGIVLLGGGAIGVSQLLRTTAAEPTRAAATAPEATPEADPAPVLISPASATSKASAEPPVLAPSAAPSVSAPLSASVSARPFAPPRPSAPVAVIPTAPAAPPTSEPGAQPTPTPPAPKPTSFNGGRH